MPRKYADYDALALAVGRAKVNFAKAESALADAHRELAELLEQQGAFYGGYASGEARSEWERNEAICAEYRPRERYCVPDLARKYGLTPRQIHRIVAAGRKKV